MPPSGTTLFFDMLSTAESSNVFTYIDGQVTQSSVAFNPSILDVIMAHLNDSYLPPEGFINLSSGTISEVESTDITNVLEV